MGHTRRALALGAALATVIVACTTVGSDPTGPSVNNEAPAQLLGLLTDPKAKPVKCKSIGTWFVAKTIGPKGGTIVVGPHQLTIPEGALPEKVIIVARVPSDTINSISLSPEGLTFAPGSPATLQLSYSNCPSASDSANKTIVYINLLGGVQELPSTDDQAGQHVETKLQHFSRYALWY